MLPAEKRDRRITFARVATVRSTLGVVEQGSWSELGSRWAFVRYGSGAERRAAAVEGAVQPATFRTLADGLTSTITVADRIEYGGLTFDIVSIAPIGRGPEEFEFTGVAARG